MRYPPLCVGDLICMYGVESIIGVVIYERRAGVYDIHVFQDNQKFTFPRGMLKKLNPTTDNKCP